MNPFISPKRAKKILRAVMQMSDILLKVPYIKQTITGGRYDFEKKAYYDTDIPNRIIKGNNTIKRYGCGQCCTAMALEYCLDAKIEPQTLSECFSLNSGSFHYIGKVEAEKRGIRAEYTNDINKVVSALKMGCPVMSIQGKGIFTSGGHYILLVGIIDGKIAVNDPAAQSRTYRISGQLYTPAQIDKACKKAGGKGYTIFYPKRLHMWVNVNDKLNIWKNQNKRHSLGYLEDGQKVSIVDDTIISKGGINWIKVKKTSGVKDRGGDYPIIGWVDSRYLTQRIK